MVTSTLWKAYQPYFVLVKKRFLMAMVLSSVSATFEIFGLSGAIFLLLQDSEQLPFGISRLSALVLFAGSLILGALAKAAADSQTYYINCDIESHCRTELIEKIVKSNWTAVRQVPQGRWISLMMSESTMVSNGVASFTSFCSNVFAIFPLILFVLIIQPLSIIPIILLVLIGLYATRRLKIRAMGIERRSQELSVVVGEQASGILANMKSVFASNNSLTWTTQLLDTVKTLYTLRSQQLLVGPKNRLTLDLVSAFGLLALVSWALLSPNNISSVALTAMALYRAMPRLQVLQQSLLNARIQKTWVDRWQKVISEFKVDLGIEEDSHPLYPNWQKVTLTGLELSQDGVKMMAQAKSLSFNRGEVIKISGQSGSGKSTLLDTLLGLLVPLETSVHVDDEKVENFALWKLSEIAYVPQSDMLGAGTLREVLCSGNSIISDTEIWNSLKLTAVDEMVYARPEQLDTEIVSVWSDLSGGEKQRLSIARAILKRPSILILDESTSALDHQTEQKIYSNISALARQTRMTVFVISHQLGTTAHDREWLIKGGNVEEITK
jgi:ABC-type multidrug transport system fused ATPase/permease subunit